MARLQTQPGLEGGHGQSFSLTLGLMLGFFVLSLAVLGLSGVREQQGPPAVEEASVAVEQASETLPPLGPAPLYDLAILGGRVIDPETGLDAAGLNVGVNGKTIAVITRDPIRGREEINARSLIVSPGFIDILSYDLNPYGVWYKLADGVTTNLAMHGAAVNMDAWYRAMAAQEPPIHYGGAFLYEAARRSLGIGRYQAATPAQIEPLTALAERALRDGAPGLSFSPEYAPGTSAEEILSLMSLARRYDAPVFFHVRYSDMEEPGTNLDALREVIDYARETGAAVHIDHINSTGGTFSMEESLAMLAAARAEGVDITACTYPYDFWATYLSSARFDPGWRERFRISFEDLQIAGTEERLTPESFERYRREGKLAAAYAIPEEDVVAALRAPFVMIGSDAILEPGNNNHPRASGTFARTIGVYVRERGVLSLTEALAKMTVMPARRLEERVPALRRKGRLQVGADADIVVFDYNRIRDNATVAEPNRFSSGIEYVVVNGLVVKEGDRFREVRPGTAIRVQDRVEPVGVGSVSEVSVSGSGS